MFITTAKRLDVTSLLAVSTLLSFPAICGAQPLPPAAEQMAKTYGWTRSGKSQGFANPGR